MTLRPAAQGSPQASSPWHPERGAVLVQVALSMMVLLGFCAFVIDYGVLWVARAQAQNAADAGALAGATTLAFDESFDTIGPPALSTAQASAIKTAETGSVWGQSPVVVVATGDIRDSASKCDPPLPTLPAPPYRWASCIDVHVFRNAANGNAMPTYFARLFGLSSQDVQAHATALRLPANVATCVWPLAIPDRWDELSVPPDDKFSNWGNVGGVWTALTGQDNYVEPNATGGLQPTGYFVSDALLTDILPDLGGQLQLTGLLSSPGTPSVTNPWPPLKKDLAVAVQIGGGSFTSDLRTCNATPQYFTSTPLNTPSLSIDTSATATWPAAASGAVYRMGTDATAAFDGPPNAPAAGATYRIRGSCAATHACTGAFANSLISPRLVVVPVFSPEEYDKTRANATPTIKIVNFVGMFIGGATSGSLIQGHMATYPGTVDPNKPFVPYEFSFLRTAALIR